MHQGAWLGALIVLAAGGCSRESPAPSATAPAGATTVAVAVPLTLEQALERARDIDARRGGWRSVPGTLQAGEAGSRFVIFYDAGVARLLEERLGAGGSGTARYYLDTTARLFLFQSHAVRATAGGSPEVVELRMVFEPDGRVVASQQWIDGRLQPVGKDQVEAVVRRLEALRSAAPRL